jgi:hypothetical protein
MLIAVIVGDRKRYAGHPDQRSAGGQEQAAACTGSVPHGSGGCDGRYVRPRVHGHYRGERHGRPEGARERRDARRLPPTWRRIRTRMPSRCSNGRWATTTSSCAWKRPKPWARAEERRASRSWSLP